MIQYLAQENFISKLTRANIRAIIIKSDNNICELKDESSCDATGFYYSENPAHATFCSKHFLMGAFKLSGVPLVQQYEIHKPRL